jgi:hypothetical protein
MQGIQVWESVLFIISIFPMKQNATYTPDTYFNDHFKLRSELSYNKTDLEHFGMGSRKTLDYAKMLRAMKGSTAVTNIGVQLSISLSASGISLQNR